jgi:hypothetical protein
MDYEPLRLLPEFRWAVPAAFLDALGSCAFGRGDWLYSQAHAYQAWEPTSKSHHFLAIQVLEPEREQTATPSVPTFTRNWSAPTTIVLRSYPDETSRTISTTLGNIYRCLWTGETAVLESPPWPSPPTLVSDFFKKNAPEWAPILRSVISRKKLNCSVAFGLPWDSSMPLYRAKREKVERAWAGLGGKWIDLLSNDILTEDSRPHAPTLRFSCFYLTRPISESEVEEALRNALATIPRAEDGSPTAGRVRIKSHGRIIWL